MTHLQKFRKNVVNFSENRQKTPLRKSVISWFRNQYTRYVPVSLEYCSCLLKLSDDISSLLNSSLFLRYGRWSFPFFFPWFFSQRAGLCYNWKDESFLWSFYSENWIISKIRLIYLIGVFAFFIFLSLHSILKIPIRIPRFGIRLLGAINRKYTSCLNRVHSDNVTRHVSVLVLVVVIDVPRIISCKNTFYCTLCTKARVHMGSIYI